MVLKVNNNIFSKLKRNVHSIKISFSYRLCNICGNEKLYQYASDPLVRIATVFFFKRLNFFCRNDYMLFIQPEHPNLI